MSYLVGKKTRVVVTPAGGEPVELAVPVEYDGDVMKTRSIHVTDNGLKVVFVEYYFEKDNPEFLQGMIVSLDITSEGGLPEVRIRRGILDIVGTESNVASVVKGFVVISELPDRE